jgi:hypothetical protein
MQVYSCGKRCQESKVDVNWTKVGSHGSHQSREECPSSINDKELAL